MITLGITVGVLLVICLWFAINRYSNNQTTANVWFVAAVLVCCIVFVVQVLYFVYRYRLGV